MFRRLFAAHLCLLLLALAVSAVLVARRTRERVLDEIASRLASDAEMLRPVVCAATGDEALEGSLRDLGQRMSTRLTVIRPDGWVRADSDADPERMQNHNDRPEVVEARARGRGQGMRLSATLHCELMYYALLLDPREPQGAVVRASLPVSRVNQEVSSLYAGILGVFLLVAVAGAAVTWILARRLTLPLRRIREVADAIAGGDLARKAPLRSTEEIASVARAMNRMEDELAARLASLEAERTRLAAVFGTMDEGVMAVGQDGGILHHNAAAAAMLGLSGDARSLRVWDAVRHPAVQGVVRKALDEGTPSRTLIELGPRVLAMRVNPIRPGAGAVVVLQDATEEQRYHTLRKEFVANVSHELRTPISLIQGFVETLQSGALADAQRATEFLETIEKHVRRLAAIVEDLLELSRLESAGQVVRPRPVDAFALASRVTESLRPLAEQKRQQLRCEASPADGSFEADPEMAERALGNIVDNAIKYTSEGGRIVVSVRGDANAITFQVLDDGIGIPEADLARIFERFYRVDKSRSRELGGTGLGLAIVKHIAQLHGGAVGVKSTVGAGSAFTLSFPRRRA